VENSPKVSFNKPFNGVEMPYKTGDTQSPILSLCMVIRLQRVFQELPNLGLHCYIYVL